VNWAISHAQEMATGSVYSKGYIYADREADDWQGVGMYMREACDTTVRWGNVLYLDYPYNIEVPDAFWQIEGFEKSLRAIAQKYRSLRYAHLTTSEEIKRARMAGLGVVFAARLDTREVDSNFVFHAGNGYLGSHGMAIADWSDAYPAEYKVPNSWGEGWGENGYCYMSAEDILAADNVFSLEFIDAIEPEQENKTRRTLRKGMSGDDVMQLKSWLVQLGFLAKASHNTFRTDTENAVKAFQTVYKLKVDGVVGRQTWGKLDALMVAPTPKPIVCNEEIVSLETSLKTLVGKPYVIGGQGHAYTKEYILSRARKNPDYFTNGRLSWMLGRANPNEQAYDCSGLFMQWAQGRYFKTDLNAHGVFRNCVEIKRDEVQAGDILFRSNGTRMVHMAIVGYDGMYEAAGGCYGVVFRKSIFDRATPNLMTGKVDNLKAWTHYGRPKIWK
jgi:hypothetical protein